MALPADLYSVIVTGTFLDFSGAAVSGNVTFTPSVAVLADSTGSVVIPAASRKYTITGGALTTDPLMATDNALTPSSWTYTITLSLQNIPQVTYSAISLPSAPHAYTATNATPCVFTATGSAYANGNPVKLTGAGVPTGFTAGTTYYVVSVSGTSFSLAATSGGSAIASSGTGSGYVSTASTDLSALI